MPAAVTRLFLVVASLMLAAPVVVDAQQAGKVYRIGYMSIASPGAEISGKTLETAQGGHGRLTG